MPRSMRPLGGSPFKAIGKPLMLGSLLVLSASCSGKEEPSANTAAVTAGGGDSGSATSSPSSSSQAASAQSGAGGATSITAVTSGTTNAGGSGAVTSSTADVTASTTTSTSSDSSSTGHGGPRPGGAVTIDGPQILVQGEPLHLRGVNWNPVPKGGTHPQDLAYAEFAAEDIALMQAAGINAVRTYEPLTDPAVLDALAAAGIFVLNTVYPYGGNAVDLVDAPVNASKDHPAILMWVIGNEWNYNGLYVDLDLNSSIQRINDVAERIRSLDTEHPIATIYGELPDASVLGQLAIIDIWGLNVYSGRTFGDRFAEWASRSDKPMFFGEYGADAWNATTNEYDPMSQAMATEDLTNEILDNSILTGGVCSGGTIFEFADEWWKDGSGSPDTQDIGGIAPGGGPYPDSTFNEEYWGIVTIDREPRPAYDVLKALYLP